MITKKVSSDESFSNNYFDTQTISLFPIDSFIIHFPMKHNLTLPLIINIFIGCNHLKDQYN